MMSYGGVGEIFVAIALAIPVVSSEFDWIPATRAVWSRWFFSTPITRSPPHVFVIAATSLMASFVHTVLKSCRLLSVGCAWASEAIAAYRRSLLREPKSAVKRSTFIVGAIEE